LKWLLRENLDVMTANMPGNFLTERVDLRTVPPAKVATYTEQKKIGGVPGILVEGKAGVVLGLNKNSNEGKIEPYHCKKTGGPKAKRSPMLLLTGEL